jgi:hypothetical protein
MEFVRGYGVLSDPVFSQRCVSDFGEPYWFEVGVFQHDLNGLDVVIFPAMDCVPRCFRTPFRVRVLKISDGRPQDPRVRGDHFQLHIAPEGADSLDQWIVQVDWVPAKNRIGMGVDMPTPQIDKAIFEGASLVENETCHRGGETRHYLFG